MKIRFFPTVEGNSQSPVKTLLFPISPLLDDEDKFASRQRAPRPGLVLKKGQRNSYRLFKTWPPDSIIRDIAVPLETHFPKAGSLPCFQVSGRLFSSIAGLYPQLDSDFCCQTLLPPPLLWWSNFSSPSLQPGLHPDYRPTLRFMPCVLSKSLNFCPVSQIFLEPITGLHLVWGYSWH